MRVAGCWPLKLGVKFPQDEAGIDPIAIRDYAQAAEDLGFDYLTATDHVIGADPSGRIAPWIGPYTHESAIHEPFVLFGFMAGVTHRITFATNVLILPQRQTVLVAKQAAALDVLSGGRLWLGVGVGWNTVEYEALGAEFGSRGARLEEQISLLRALWTQRIVSFNGRWHRITRAGIHPMPIQRPIPIWMGGASDRAIDRAGRIADGWFPGGSVIDPFQRAPSRANPGRPLGGPGIENWAPQIERLLASARAAGRKPSAIAVGAQFNVLKTTPTDDFRSALEQKAAIGSTHMTIATERAGLRWPQGHIDALRRVRET